MSNYNDLMKEYNEMLEGALLSCDLWEVESLKSVANYNKNLQADSLKEVIVKIFNLVEELGLPPIGEYQLIDLEMNTAILAINLNKKHVLMSVIDKSKVKFGALISIIIPDIIAACTELQIKEKK